MDKQQPITILSDLIPLLRDYNNGNYLANALYLVTLPCGEILVRPLFSKVYKLTQKWCGLKIAKL